MGAMYLEGQLFKDINYNRIPDTWTGFVKLMGRDRLIVAVEVRFNEDGYILAKEDYPDTVRLVEDLIKLNAYNMGRFKPIKVADGSQYVIFMPPE